MAVNWENYCFFRVVRFMYFRKLIEAGFSISDFSLSIRFFPTKSFYKFLMILWWSLKGSIRSSWGNFSLFSWVLVSFRYSSMPQITVALFLKFCVMIRSFLVESSIRASPWFLVKCLYDDSFFFLWFLISSFTAISNVWMVVTLLLGLNAFF